MKTLTFVFALVGIFLSLSAQADEGWYLNLGGVSKHATKRLDGQPWNEKNYGAGLQRVTQGTLWGSNVQYYQTLGVVKNSEFGLSTYVGGGVKKAVLESELASVSLGLYAGLMNYPSKYNAKNGDGMFPVVLPMVTTCLGTDDVCIESTYIPKHGYGSSAAVLVQLRISLYK